MNSFRRIILSFFFISGLVIGHAANPEWETMPVSSVENTDTEKTDITVKDGYIYITAHKPVAVKVFSILGQLISQETIPAGTSRLRISTRGIYILKIGTQTKRVTI